MGVRGEQCGDEDTGTTKDAQQRRANAAKIVSSSSDLTPAILGVLECTCRIGESASHHEVGEAEDQVDAAASHLAACRNTLLLLSSSRPAEPDRDERAQRQDSQQDASGEGKEGCDHDSCHHAGDEGGEDGHGDANVEILESVDILDGAVEDVAAREEGGTGRSPQGKGVEEPRPPPDHRGEGNPMGAEALLESEW